MRNKNDVKNGVAWRTNEMVRGFRFAVVGGHCCPNNDANDAVGARCIEFRVIFNSSRKLVIKRRVVTAAPVFGGYLCLLCLDLDKHRSLEA